MQWKNPVTGSQTQLNLNNPNILVAELDDSIYKLISLEVSQNTITLTRACDCDELTQQLLLHSIDVIFLRDNFLGDNSNSHIAESGLLSEGIRKSQTLHLASLVRRIKAVSKSSKVVIIADEDAPSISAELITAGVDDYLNSRSAFRRFLRSLESNAQFLIQNQHSDFTPKSLVEKFAVDGDLPTDSTIDVAKNLAAHLAGEAPGNEHYQQTLSFDDQYPLSEQSPNPDHSLAQFLENLPGCALVTDRELRLKLANENFALMTGYSLAEITDWITRSKSIDTLLPRNIFLELASILKQPLEITATDSPEKSFDLILLNKAGDGIPVQCLVKAIHLKGFDGLLLMLSDLSADLDAKLLQMHELDWSRLLSDYSQRFIDLPVNEFSSLIKTLLIQGGRLLRSERISMYLINKKLKQGSLSFEWSGANQPSLKRFSRQVELHTENSEISRLMQAEPLTLSPMELLNRDQLNDTLGLSEHLALVNSQCSYIFPLHSSGQVYGWIGFDILQAERQWQADDIGHIRELCSVVHRAMMRKHHEEMRLIRHQRLLETQGQLSEQASQDSLTGVANRRYFNEVLSAEIGRATRNHSYLSLILCDIDNFKAYNDVYGHLAGDKCLRRVAKHLKSSFKRSADFVARFGGEEFVIILPELDCQQAFEAVEKMRNALYNLNLPHEKSPFQRLTISVGLTCISNPLPDCSNLLIDRADRALYRAKHRGKNRVFVYKTHKEPKTTDNG